MDVFWLGRRACGDPPGTLASFECLPVVQGFFDTGLDAVLVRRPLR